MSQLLYTVICIGLSIMYGAHGNIEVSSTYNAAAFVILALMHVRGQR
jgi:phosphoglycerate-specific signal transduction histidine kinase